jgi:hypothetical protein
MADWTCVQTKPAEELKAKRWIQDRRHEVYLPLVRERRGAIRPLFPRYLFVVLDERWPELESLPGVSHLLRDGDKPAALRLVLPGRKRRDRPPLPTRVISGDAVIERIKFLPAIGAMRNDSNAHRYCNICSCDDWLCDLLARLPCDAGMVGSRYRDHRYLVFGC